MTNNQEEKVNQLIFERKQAKKLAEKRTPSLFVRESTSVVLPQSGRVAREPYVKELSRHILAVGFTNCSGIPRFS